MLQVRIINPDGTNPIILDGASNIVYSKALNSADEGISFSIKINDPKADHLNPYSDSSYTRFWQLWDTSKNKLLNYGPFTSISDGGNEWSVEGRGRSALLEDYFKTLKTFYARIDSVIEEVRYENLAVSPSTTTMIADLAPHPGDDTTLFKGELDDGYWALSKKSKDFIIDENTTYIPLGKIEPPRTFTTTNEYWTGTSMSDTIAVDFGDAYRVDKIRLLFPWWGGPQQATNRTYDFKLFYANSGIDGTLQGRPIGKVEEFYDNSPRLSAALGSNLASPAAPQPSHVINYGSRVVTTPARPIDLYVGLTNSGLGTTLNSYNIALDHSGPIQMRYLSVYIYNVNALYGSTYDSLVAKNYYPYQCYNGYRPGDIAGINPTYVGLMTTKNKNGSISPKEIPDTDIKPPNDCHASLVELGAYKEIVQKKSIKALAIQRIDNNNMQIEYYRVPDPSELRTYVRDGLGFKKFEPGSKFRKFQIGWSGANTEYFKFFKKDCTNCYPSGFHFGVIDDNNTLILAKDEITSSRTVKGRQYTNYIITRGSSSITLGWVDCWKGQMDVLSWGGSYSFTEKTADYFRIHFRGESLKWYATIPEGKTGATVEIKIRTKSDTPITGYATPPVRWSSWTTLEASYKLPDGPVNNEIVYEIPYGSGILASETTYQIQVTLLDDNFCSVDSIEGYWSGSFTEYNEDSSRISLSQPEVFKQINNAKFSGGHMYKWNKSGANASMYFEGDRIIIQSAMGQYHGKLTIQLLQYVDGTIDYDTGNENKVYIPGGSADGTYTVDLNTGKKGQEIPNYIIFDSNDIFPDGLPWGKYFVLIVYRYSEKYTADKNEIGSDSFQYRCSSCNPRAPGTPVSIYKYVYLDAIGLHERIGISVDFNNQTHLDIIKSVAEATQTEWDVAPEGLYFEPRIGTETDIALREGENTLVRYSITNDLTKVATTLLSVGAAIDGLDQYSITEDKESKRKFGRTIMRQHDFRDIASYNQLIGLSRSELRRRSRPEKRIIVTHTASSLDLEHGDSFILWTKKSGPIRLRIQRKQITENASGREYELECIEWPQIS